MRIYRNRSKYLAVCGLFSLSAAPLILFLTGCDNSDVSARKKASEDIKQAASQIEYVAYDGESAQIPNTTNLQDSSYTKILSILSSAGSETGGGQPLAEQQAAKDAISSGAKMGLARLHMENILMFEQGLKNSIYLLNRKIDDAIDLASMMNAAKSFDFRETLRGIDANEDSSRARKVQTERDLRNVQNQIIDLENKIQDELGEYARLQEHSAEVNLRVNEALLDDRQNLIYEAAKISREADKHQVAAALQEVNLDMIRPTLSELQNLIAQCEMELLSFEHSRSALIKREEILAREIAQTQSDLAATISQINADFADIAASYQNVIEPMYEKALDAANDSLNLARSAMSKSTLGRLRVSQANHLLGMVYWKQVQSLKPLVQILTRMVEINDILSRGNQDQALLEEINNKVSDLTEKASNAYDEAIGSAESERGNNAETLFTLKYAKALIDGVDVASIEQPVIEVPVVADAGRDKAVVGPSSDPAALVQNVVVLLKAYDFGGITKLFHTDHASESEYMGALNNLFVTIDDFNNSAKSQFDQSLYDLIKDPATREQLVNMVPALSSQGGIDPFEQFDQMGSLDVDSFSYSHDQSGTTAWIDNEPDLEDIIFVYVGDQWKIDFLDEWRPSGEILDINLRIIDAVVSSIQDVTNRANDDEFGDIWTMISSLLGQIEANVTPIITESFAIMQEEMQKAMEEMGKNFPSDGGGN